MSHLTRAKKGEITLESLYEFMTEKAATKDDLKHLATKSDIAELEVKYEERFADIESDLKKIKPLEDNLSANVASTLQLKDSIKTLKEEVDKLKKNEIRREIHERKVNLVLFGITEGKNDNKKKCLEEVRKVLKRIEVPNHERITILDCHRLGAAKKDDDGNPISRPIIFKVNDIFKQKDIFDRTDKLKNFYNDVYIRRHVPKSLRDQKDVLKSKMKELYDAGLQPKWRIDYQVFEYYIVDKNEKKYTMTNQ